MARSRKKNAPRRLTAADGSEIARPLPPGFARTRVSAGVGLALPFNAWTYYGLLMLICAAGLYAVLARELIGPGALVSLVPAAVLFAIGLGSAMQRAKWLKGTRSAVGTVVDIHLVEGASVDMGLVGGGGGTTKPSRRYVMQLVASGEDPWGSNYYTRFGRLWGVDVGDAFEVAYDMRLPLRILPLLAVPGRPTFSGGGRIHLSKPQNLLVYLAISTIILAASVALLLFKA
jgi:hypothetical protein